MLVMFDGYQWGNKVHPAVCSIHHFFMLWKLVFHLHPTRNEVCIAFLSSQELWTTELRNSHDSFEFIEHR